MDTKQIQLIDYNFDTIVKSQDSNGQDRCNQFFSYPYETSPVFEYQDTYKYIYQSAFIAVANFARNNYNILSSNFSIIRKNYNLRVLQYELLSSNNPGILINHENSSLKKYTIVPEFMFKFACNKSNCLCCKNVKTITMNNFIPNRKCNPLIDNSKYFNFNNNYHKTNKSVDVNNLVYEELFFWKPWQYLCEILPNWFVLEQFNDHRRTGVIICTVVRIIKLKNPNFSIQFILDALRKCSKDSILFYQTNIVLFPNNFQLVSTLYSKDMHDKQQIGLDSKHSYGLSLTIDDKQAIDTMYKSKKKFNRKLFTDVNVSRSNADMYEVMVILTLDQLNELYSKFYPLMRAWKTYEVDGKMYLRVEIDNLYYHQFCHLLVDNDLTIFYTSNKFDFIANSCVVKDKFIGNFINYYTFYANGESFLTLQQIFKNPDCLNLFFTWVLIAHVNYYIFNECFADYGNISMNPQAMYKFVSSPLFSIFSENSIPQFTKVNKRTEYHLDAPYVNRGINQVAGIGINNADCKFKFFIVKSEM